MKFIFKTLPLLFFILFFSLNIPKYSYAQGYDTAAGGDSTDTSGGGGQQSFDGSNDKSAANSDVSDFSGNNDFSGSNSNDFNDYSSNDNGNSFSEFVDSTFGTGSGIDNTTSPGGPAPLSNQNDTIDQSGATASLESTDTGYECSTVNCNSPVVTGITSCVGSKPVVDLSWTGDATNVSYWHIVRAQEPNPTFAQIGNRPVGAYSYRDSVLAPNMVYYFAVFGSNSGNGIGYSARTPLSDILAVYTPSCEPIITASCPADGLPERFNLTWNNNDPAASGYKIYRGVNQNPASRVFLPPKYNASTSSTTDNTVTVGTSYNYWLRSFVTVYHAAYSEVTSTDENGNPTGYQDFPAYYEDVEAPFSGMSISKSPVMCTAALPSPSVAPSVLPSPSVAPVSPTINLYLNDQPSGDLPLPVDINTPVTIRWTVNNATDCTASSTPNQSYWSGAQNPSSGTQLADTSTAGTYQFSLQCTNNGTLTTTVTSELKVRAVTDPYIQTTGGDVHSNKDIRVPNQ